MSDAPRQPQPPPKKDVALALLQQSSMYIHLDPRRPDVVVPKHFMGAPQLILQVGLNMVIPIPDLKVDDDGITCTLSFNRSPFWCRIPWSAIYALVGEDGRGGVWASDVPPEIQQQKAAPQKAAPGKKGRPKLTAVGSTSAGKDEAPAKPSRRGPQPVPAADQPQDDGIIDSEPSAAVATQAAGTEERATEAPAPKLRAVPPIAEQAKAEPAKAEPPKAEPAKAEPAKADAADGAERPSADEKDAEAAASAPPSEPPGKPAPKKGKREIPPWLRVIK
jgi:stringent starvation protein B